MVEFKEASFYKKLPEKRVHCKLCPHSCVIGNGEVGKCQVRMNIIGNLKSMYYSKPHTVGYAKMEAMPMYHFFPNSKSLIVGCIGENLTGKWYENEFSSKDPKDIAILNQTPMQIIDQAEKVGVNIISYGYNEPLISYEYVYELSDNSRRMKHLLITNGFIEEEPIKEISKKIEGCLVEVKSMDEDFYKNILSGDLKVVLKNIKILHNNDVWVEIRMRLIPGIHEDLYDVRKLTSWILNELDPNVPLHLVGVGMDSEIVKKARKTAMESGMNYVYTHGIDYQKGQNTQCVNCEKDLITRENGFIHNNIKEGKCVCGKEIAGIWY